MNEQLKEAIQDALEQYDRDLDSLYEMCRHDQPHACDHCRKQQKVIANLLEQLQGA